MTVLVASLDEWHQTFIPSRTGTVRDVILDSGAALTAQIVIFLLLRKTSTRF
jgi:VanZ family protein